MDKRKLAFVYDKVNTRFGKGRVLLVSGWLIMAFATLMMYNWAASKGHGVVVFVLFYVIYIIGYTLYNMTGQTFHSYMIFGKEQRVGALVKGREYYVRVDAFNENGITEGAVTLATESKKS